MWVQGMVGVGGWRICLPGVSDVITLSRTMSHLWLNQTTVTVYGVSAALCVTLHLHRKTLAIWVTEHHKNIFLGLMHTFNHLPGAT